MIQRYLLPDRCIEPLLCNLKQLIGTNNLKPPKYVLPLKIIQDFPQILAYLSTIWTIQNSDYYFEIQEQQNQKDYLLIPHAGQIIALLRLIGSSDKIEELKNNLIQVNTGEGKSLILAFSSAFLALVGYDVSCVCYSNYLSERDYKAFSQFFDVLGVGDNIHYSIFSQLCNKFINQYGDMRKNIESIITTGKICEKSNVDKNTKPKILLVDEVDVFFSKDFYGNTYNPISQLKNDNIISLLSLIWEKRNTQLTLEEIKQHEIYKKTNDQYKQWNSLLENQVKRMIKDLKQYLKEQNIHILIKEEQKIGYQDQDSINFNVFYGYKTIFAYFYEYDNKNITKQCLQENASLLISCGQFSYAEIPSKFAFVMGVTGTLVSLSKSEKEVIEKEYKIQKQTIIPSVYGPNLLEFKYNLDCKVVSSDYFPLSLQREIQDRIKGKNPGTQRSILVFFENRASLMNFYESPVFKDYRAKTQYMTEQNTDDEKESIIKNSTQKGQITLLTKCFARGTDFVQRDDIVSANGGVHVIQTFLSENKSEQVQTMGRTARQGENGSFSLIILDTSLEKYKITKNDIEEQKNNLYKFLDEKRNIFFDDKCQKTKKKVEQARSKHQNTMKLIENVQKENIKEIKSFILTQDQ